MATHYQTLVAYHVRAKGAKIDTRSSIKKRALIEVLEVKLEKMKRNLTDDTQALERATKLNNKNRIAELQASIQKRNELIAAITSTITKQKELLVK